MREKKKSLICTFCLFHGVDTLTTTDFRVTFKKSAHKTPEYLITGSHEYEPAPAHHWVYRSEKDQFDT